MGDASKGGIRDGAVDAPRHSNRCEPTPASVASAALGAPDRCHSGSSADPGSVRRVDPRDMPDWDAWVASHPDSTFFHSAAWAHVLHDTYGYGPVYVAAFDHDRLLGLIPCMEVRGLWGVKRGISLPWTDNTAPLVSPNATFRVLCDAVIACGRKAGWRTWECRGAAEWIPEAQVSVSFHHHTLDLRRGEAGLHSGFASSVKRAIRKAERNRLEVCADDSEAAVDAFYKLHCRTRQRQGMPVQPKAFFDHIQRHVLARGAGRVVFARHQGRPVAGAMFFEWNGRAFYKFGASDESHLGLRPNNLVLAHAIRSFCARGFTTLDFGRTSLAHEGLRRFKAGWGATESRLSYFMCDLRKGIYLTARDRAIGWHNALFRCLPRPALRVAGSLLYRHLA